MNNINITGRLTQDPELRALPSGSTVCRLRLAVDGMGRGGRDEVGYINVSAFGNAGEAAARVLSKGWLVAVDGRLQYGEWETDDGSRHDYEIVGNVEFLAAPRSEQRPAGRATTRPPRRPRPDTPSGRAPIRGARPTARGATPPLTDTPRGPTPTTPRRELARYLRSSPAANPRRAARAPLPRPRAPPTRMRQQFHDVAQHRARSRATSSRSPSTATSTSASRHGDVSGGTQAIQRAHGSSGPTSTSRARSQPAHRSGRPRRRRRLRQPGHHHLYWPLKSRSRPPSSNAPTRRSRTRSAPTPARSRRRDDPAPAGNPQPQAPPPRARSRSSGSTARPHRRARSSRAARRQRPPAAARPRARAQRPGPAAERSRQLLRRGAHRPDRRRGRKISCPFHELSVGGRYRGVSPARSFETRL